MFRDLEALLASTTQTGPVAAKGSSLSVTQRNKRDGSKSLDSCIDELCDFAYDLYSPGNSVSTISFIKKS